MRGTQAILLADRPNAVIVDTRMSHVIIELCGV